MKNKKGFILFGLLTIVSCFFCIGNAKAYTQDEFQHFSLNTFRYLANKAYNDEELVNNLMNNYTKYSVVYSKSSDNSLSRIVCYFLPNNKYSVSIVNSNYANNSSTISGVYYFRYEVATDSFDTYRNTSITSPNLTFFYNNANYPIRKPNDSSKNVVASFADEGFKINNKTYDFLNWTSTDYYNFVNAYNVNFHLNGSKIAVFNPNTFNLDIYDNDVILNSSSDDFNRFLNGTIMKPNYEFEGWYYDEEFTQPFSPDDTISSDINLYAKFRSKIYYTNDIDYIEIKYDNLPLRDTNINYDYTIRSVFSNGDENTVDFSQPFGREYYTGCDDDNSNCSPKLRYKDKLFYDLGFIGYYYTHEENLVFNSNPEHITSSYSIIIPLETSIANWIYIDFNSNYDYEIIVHYKHDDNDDTSVSNYLQTIDLTNKYGAIFLPLYDNTAYADDGSFYLTNFKILGTVDVQVTDSRDLIDYNILQLYSMNYCNNLYLEQSDIPYNCNNSSGVFQFKIDNKTANQTLRFVNVNYSSSVDVTTKITYDTRFFNYGILDSPYSSVDIVDPTTGETNRVGLSDFYNQLDKVQNNRDFKSSLNRFLNPIKFIFSYVTKIFYNYLNSSLKDYFFFLFCLTLIILIMRVIF